MIVHAQAAERPSSHRALPDDPELRRRHFVDGLVQVPLDLVRDPELGPGDVRVACALAALAFGTTEVIELNKAISRLCAVGKRQLELSLLRLEATGWIARAKAPGTKHRRRIVLLWKLPDDFSDATQLTSLPRPKRSALRVVGEMLPLGDGGEP